MSDRDSAFTVGNVNALEKQELVREIERLRAKVKELRGAIIEYHDPRFDVVSENPIWRCPLCAAMDATDE